MNKRVSKSLSITAALLFAAPLWATDNDGHSAGEVLDDTLITTKVKGALVADPVTKAYQISVDTYKGVVKLSGNVDSPEAEQRAVQVAKDIEGVSTVEDHLSVRQ